MRRRGSYALELALTLPILVAMVGGIVDWGWYFSAEYKVQEAARVCARTGASTDQDDGPETAAEAAARSVLDAEGLVGRDAVVATSIAGSAAGDLLTCSVELELAPMVGLVPVLTNRRATVTMRLEDQ